VVDPLATGGGAANGDCGGAEMDGGGGACEESSRWGRRTASALSFCGLCGAVGPR